MKGELNNDGQQFHKYQAIEHNNDHNIWRWKFQVLAWDRHKNVAGLHQLIRSQPVPKILHLLDALWWKPSSDTLKANVFKSQIILKSLGVRKPKSLKQDNQISSDVTYASGGDF